MISSRTFILGEEKYVEFEVGSRNPNESIVVTNATYKLIYHKTEETECEGNCEIDGRYLRILLAPTQRGIYHLLLTVEVPPEILKGTIDIVVKECD